MLYSFVIITCTIKNTVMFLARAHDVLDFSQVLSMAQDDKVIGCGKVCCVYVFVKDGILFYVL
jgi:hypothetical protein